VVKTYDNLYTTMTRCEQVTVKEDLHNRNNTIAYNNGTVYSR